MDKYTCKYCYDGFSNAIQFRTHLENEHDLNHILSVQLHNASLIPKSVVKTETTEDGKK